MIYNNKNKTTWHHQNSVHPPQRVLDTQNTPEKQDSDLKSYVMMLVGDFNKGINNSLKEIQENTAKQVEALKGETQNPTRNTKKTLPNR
jgi:ornithine carbamoyltransferase